nr:MAG TPA: hypothetical protein [Caudoviricetes sp.]
MKNWVLPNEYPVYLLHPLKPINSINKAPNGIQFYFQ